MDSTRIDELARKLLESVPAALRGMQQDLEANFRTVLHSALGKLDLVTRDEFAAQSKVLERTRAKADELAARVSELERALSEGAAGTAGTRGGPKP